MSAKIESIDRYTVKQKFNPGQRYAVLSNYNPLLYPFLPKFVLVFICPQFLRVNFNCPAINNVARSVDC